jgi:hypothetical protein
MLIVEIVVSGLKGLPASLRVAPQGGVNVFPAISPERRRRFLDALFHTLHPDAAGPERVLWLADPTQQSSRLAVAARAKDGQIYRLMRDFGTGAARLYKKQGEGSDWGQLSADVGEIAQFVRVQLRGPPFTAYERLYVLAPGMLVGSGQAESRSGGPLWPATDRGAPAGMGGGGLGGNLGYGSALGPASLGNAPLRMPSALGPAAAFASSIEPPPAFTSQDLPNEALLSSPSRSLSFAQPTIALFRTAIEAAQLPFDAEAARREYARLLKHVEIVRGARGMRVELDALTRRREALKAAVAEVQAAYAAADEARAEAERFVHLDGLPAGIGDRIRDLDGADVRRHKELARLAEERAEAERIAREAQPVPLQRDPVFVGGLIIWALVLLWALSVGSIVLSLLNVVGAALAAFAALTHVGALERAARLGTRLASVDDKAARLDKQYELETGVARKLIAQLDLDPAELLEQLDAAHVASAARAAAEHRVAVLEADPARRRAIDELSQLEAHIDELENQLLSVEGSETGSAQGEELERRLATMARELTERGVDLRAVPRSTSTTGHDEPPRRARAWMGDDDERLVSGRSDVIRIELPGAEDSWSRFTIGGGGFPPGSGGGVSGYGGEGPAPTDGTAALGAALADVVHRPIEVLGPALVPRLAQYLRAFTGGAFVGAEVGPGGELRVRPAEAEGTAPLSAVDPIHQRAVEAAIHLAWLEAAVSRVAVPVLMDDPFVGLPPPVRKLIGKALGYVGERAQVIVLTPEADLAGHVLGG